MENAEVMNEIKIIIGNNEKNDIHLSLLKTYASKQFCVILSHKYFPISSIS